PSPLGGEGLGVRGRSLQGLSPSPQPRSPKGRGASRTDSNLTAVVSCRAVWPRAYGRGTPVPGAGVAAARPTTPAPARPASAGPTPGGAAASAPRGHSAGRARRPLFAPRGLHGPRPDDRHHGEGEQAQGDVPVPPDPRAHLVLVQAAIPFTQLKTLLDRPPRP